MKGWRTIAWNVIGLLGLVAIFQDWIVPTDARAEVLAYHAAIFGAGNLGLRAVTTTPVGRKRR